MQDHSPQRCIMNDQSTSPSKQHEIPSFSLSEQADKSRRNLLLFSATLLLISFKIIPPSCNINLPYFTAGIESKNLILCILLVSIYELIIYTLRVLDDYYRHVENVSTTKYLKSLDPIQGESALATESLYSKIKTIIDKSNISQDEINHLTTGIERHLNWRQEYHWIRKAKIFLVDTWGPAVIAIASIILATFHLYFM